MHFWSIHHIPRERFFFDQSSPTPPPPPAAKVNMTKKLFNAVLDFPPNLRKNFFLPPSPLPLVAHQVDKFGTKDLPLPLVAHQVDKFGTKDLPLPLVAHQVDKFVTTSLLTGQKLWKRYLRIILLMCAITNSYDLK